MKIVSLVPSASEIICDLGLEKNLVGVSHECNYPISLQKINTVTSSNIDSAKSQREIDKSVREKVNETIKDKNEIQESIEKLHDAINKINKEGVSRLRDAFQIVNENFERLFTKLFGGGKAYLKLVQNDEDPLNSGLEIFASPPGKKMQNITLLSGGEQALTAISLLFAVFIANPSPFCILDEVDAPLDDNNVDRFCSMVEEISQKVQTKFIIITHNRMTMSRVDRLYGVTMPEEGVSQIVSVELEEAIQYAE